MNILFAVFNANASGSVMNATRRQAEYLASSGHTVTLISNEPPQHWAGVRCIRAEIRRSPTGRFAEYVINGLSRRLSARLTPCDLQGAIAQYRFPDSLASVIAGLCLRQPVDGIICCQHFCAPGLVRVRKDFGIPFLLVAHGDVFSHPNSSFSRPLRRLYRSTARLSYREARHVVAVGSALAARARELGADETHVSVIPNGIDPQEIGAPTSDMEASPTACGLLYVGRLAPEKAVDVLIRAMPLLRHRDVHLRIIGDGPCRVALRRLAQSTATAGTIEFVGNVPRAGLSAYYKQAGIVVLPSLSEAQPVVTLEASICGRPIIASHVGGVPDVVKHQWNGLLVPPGDARSLAEAIDKLLADPLLRAAMGRNGHSLAPEFSWQAVLERFALAVQRAFAADANAALSVPTHSHPGENIYARNDRC